jgi:cysteamine dioxygenase
MGNRPPGVQSDLDGDQDRDPFLLEVIFHIIQKVSADAVRGFIENEPIPMMSGKDVETISKVLSRLTAAELGLQPMGHLQISPSTLNPSTDIRYFHVAELEDQYSIGIFLMPPGTKMPLHDHPYMCVFSRILTGSLLITSMDWTDSKALPCSRTRAREAVITQDLTLEAPYTLHLTPDSFNLHALEAGEEGCAFLDVLIPPYKEGDDHRDCTYYAVTNPSSENGVFDLISCDPPTSFNIVHGTLDLC